MELGNLLDVIELHNLIELGFIRRRNHPSLPLAILNYDSSCMFDDFWPETVQHCRGLIVDTNTNGGELLSESIIISRPFHKFFNLNHSNQELSQEANLPTTIPTVTEKMDGWFGILWHYGDQYGIASRGSFDSIGAQFATAKLGKLIKYGAIDEFPKGYSAIFEIIFKEGKIVVDYPYEGLVLLGLVNNETGEELPYDELFKIWAKILTYSTDQKPWIRLVKAHSMSVHDCLTSDKKNFEGFVLSYPRLGTWPIKIKVKLEDYKRLHKLITGVTPQQIWKTVHDPMAVWLDNEVPNHFRAWAIKWRNQLYKQFQLELSNVMRDATDVRKAMSEAETSISLDRKLAFQMLEELNSEYASIAMTLLDGKIYEAHQAIWKRVRPIGREEVFYREGTGE